MNPPLTAEAALNRYYLETRCKIIEIAANLDRIDRGTGATGITIDPRLAKVREAISALTDGKPDRAERCQRVFSLPYESNWPHPNRP
ncbi:MAG TPA: hypothetical protein VJZ71_21660 [Phycisphaerae bacterium]|nr:hypothetical protein [Phycisphaerae bacterium]